MRCLPEIRTNVDFSSAGCEDSTAQSCAITMRTLLPVEHVRALRLLLVGFLFSTARALASCSPRLRKLLGVQCKPALFAHEIISLDVVEIPAKSTQLILELRRNRHFYVTITVPDYLQPNTGPDRHRAPVTVYRKGAGFYKG